jgi:hypothetical protein
MPVAIRLITEFGAPDFTYIGSNRGGDPCLVTSRSRAQTFKTAEAAERYWQAIKARFRTDTQIEMIELRAPQIRMKAHCRRCRLTEEITVTAAGVLGAGNAPRCRNCGRADLVLTLPPVNPARVTAIDAFADLDMAS